MPAKLGDSDIGDDTAAAGCDGGKEAGERGFPGGGYMPVRKQQCRHDDQAGDLSDVGQRLVPDRRLGIDLRVETGNQRADVLHVVGGRRRST